ncbi:YoaK family protein [Pseudomonas alliivorans]|nr:YoaK family protein [Pseudomonas alliivorans]MEE4626114.1 YoaK family protein [Pseudomonas alliivorans]MEE4753032.1 YoaK family protein [Pseudomonas alliivorans]MEE4885839.1 YoaK family protein [Pseudomonas alliivorans]MEE4892580.1 YoaK family protein [Pseudomonas alliivorans]
MPSAFTHARFRYVALQKRRTRVGMTLAASLSVLAGMTDAIGFMATGDFVSFMSGNTTRLAVALGEGDMGMTARLSLAIVVFIAGNALGIVIARLGNRRALPLLLVVATLLCAAAAWPMEKNLLALVWAILAMGMLNAAVEQVNGQSVGLTYVTGALSRFGRGLGRWLMGERRNGWQAQLIPWFGMFIGAVVGALIERRLGLNALLVSAGLSALLGLVSLGIPHRWQRLYMPR